MVRRFLCGLFVGVALAVADVDSASAAPTSPNNPYRSFNISGVNYGSMRWEQSHRRGRTAYNAGGWRLFRRR